MTTLDFALALLGLTGAVIIAAIVLAAVDASDDELRPPERPIDLTGRRR